MLIIKRLKKVFDIDMSNMSNGKYAFVIPDFSAFGIKENTLGESVFEKLSEKTPEFYLVKANIEVFGDQSFRPRLNESIRERPAYIFMSPYVDPSKQVTLTGMMLDECRRANADRSKINLMETYNSWYPQDKRDVGKRDPVSIRAFGRMYMDSGLKHLFYFEPHSQEALDCVYESVDPIFMAAFHAKNLAEEFEVSDLVVLRPDEGGIKRAKKLSEALGVELVGINKIHYDAAKSEKVITTPVMEDLSGKTVIIYDDIIRSGSTVVGAAQAAKIAGAKRVIADATHLGLYNPDKIFGSEAVDAVRGTNTIPLHPTHAKLREYDISDFAAEILYRKSHGMDVSGYIMNLAPAAKKHF